VSPGEATASVGSGSHGRRSAEEIAERLARAALSPSAPMLDVHDAAAFAGVGTSYVYEHEAELGARRLPGKRGRLRFALQDLERAVSCSGSRGSDQPVGGTVEPKRRGRSGRSAGTSVALLPVRGQERAA
jgi:hypothetical protein